MSKNKQSLLWEVTKSPSSPVSYLFGTMHIKDQRAFRLQQMVYQKIIACEAFATEFNLDDANPAGAIHFTQLPPGQRLSDFYSPRQYAKMERMLFKAFGLQLSLFQGFQPMLLANFISEKILSNDMPFSLDEHLFRFAKAQQKEIKGIETYEEQMAIFHKIPFDYQLKALLWMSKHVSRHRKQLLQMTAVYEKGDLRQIYQSTKKNAGGLRKMLLFNRNQIMAERIRPIMEEQSLFAAIGAGHLGGQKGVLRLLKAYGFRLKPIFPEY